MITEFILLFIILGVIGYAFYDSRKKKTQTAKHSKEEVIHQKEAYAKEDIMSYGQVQERRNELFQVIDDNLGDHPEQSFQLKQIINDWADLKIKVFEERRSWVRSPKKK